MAEKDVTCPKCKLPARNIGQVSFRDVGHPKQTVQGYRCAHGCTSVDRNYQTLQNTTDEGATFPLEFVVLRENETVKKVITCIAVGEAA